MGVAGASAIVCNAASAAVARLSAGTAGFASGVTDADVRIGAARATDTGSAAGAGYSSSADTGVTAAARVAVAAIAIGTTLGARSVAAVLG